MSAKVPSVTKAPSADRAAQQESAKELQRQIDEIVSGKVPGEPPRNLRDFVNEKMAEDARRKLKRAPAKRAKVKPGS